MMPSKRVILEQMCVFFFQRKTKKKVNQSSNNMLRRPHKQTFLRLQSGPRLHNGHGDRSCIAWDVRRCSWPGFDVDGWLNFFFPLRLILFPATAGGRARARRDLLCSVSGKGTPCVASVTPRGTQALSCLVVKPPWISMDSQSLGDRTCCTTFFKFKVSFLSFPCCSLYKNTVFQMRVKQPCIPVFH